MKNDGEGDFEQVIICRKAKKVAKSGNAGYQVFIDLDTVRILDIHHFNPDIFFGNIESYINEKGANSSKNNQELVAEKPMSVYYSAGKPLKNILEGEFPELPKTVLEEHNGLFVTKTDYKGRLSYCRFCRATQEEAEAREGAEARVGKSELAEFGIFLDIGFSVKDRLKLCKVLPGMGYCIISKDPMFEKMANELKQKGENVIFGIPSFMVGKPITCGECSNDV